ncbi:hypothetical protein QWZ08_07840 [Ferruginibacter paludis]|uniref:hypothetical protein n=1 Tax=Ferruginibacter paludis TaxID=1310417 RepID=UPI0025B295A2|nr:hypothetical protein [Ferruginibacter paludis]MDN3655532.1 hypothetical protein [Ferruginibacter paludis]
MNQCTTGSNEGNVVQLKHDNKVVTASAQRGKYFFVIMASIFPVISLIGFIPSYVAMNAGEFNIHWSAHVHGALMVSWLIVYILQSWLALKGNFKFHRALGLYAAGLGIIIWCSMGVASAHALIGNAVPADSFLFDILLVQLYIMQVFGFFFTWGILVRKNGPAHKRLLFLATLVLMQAAIDRMPWLQAGAWPFICLDLMLIPLFIYDWITLKRIHPVTWTGLLVYIAAQVAVTTTFGSPAWHTFWFNLVSRFY